MEWLFDRLKESSTWLGIIATVVGVTGITVPDELSGYIVAGGCAIAGIVLFVIKQHKSS
jgi:hypothetical protein